eukprot:TRINITY_DN6208_c0_g2_i1.p1 TRINITY_DN6208_c0_g2~~TRINITY_DN6208_c0_g2_i1.p1  ORF type:complete len:472 (-),score=111.77 TRINITY_DN6208_c0_g2_i1:115-1530(-)
MLHQLLVDPNSVVLTKDGQIWTFGSNKYGQLGLGDFKDRDTPTRVATLYTNVTQIACGDNHTLCVSQHGHLYSWGLNKNGQLGHGDYVNRDTPLFVNALSETNVLRIAAGGGYDCSHSLVLVEYGLGALYSFGSGSYGQLGYPVDEEKGNQPIPRKISFFEKKVIKDFSCGALHSLVIVEKENSSTVARKSYLPFFHVEIDNRPKLGYFETLPVDICRNISEILAPLELTRLSCACKYFMYLCNEDAIWEFWSKKNYGEYYERATQSRVPWKCIYRNQHSGQIPQKKQTGFLSSIVNGIRNIVSTKKITILMIGLDAAGKTSILFKLRLGEVVTTIPTIGFNVETVEYKNILFRCWDVGGPDKIRPLWRHYYTDTSCIIFVVDSNDRYRLPQVVEEMNTLLREDRMRHLPLLVFANKQDLPRAMTVNEVRENLGLEEVGRGRPWLIQGTSAATGDGLYEGLDWLSQILQKS